MNYWSVQMRQQAAGGVRFWVTASGLQCVHVQAGLACKFPSMIAIDMPAMNPLTYWSYPAQLGHLSTLSVTVMSKPLPG